MPDGAPQPAVLGIERSLGGRRWQTRTGSTPEADERLGMALAQRLDLPEIVGRLLANRGVTPETAGDFLEPSLKAALPDPSHLRDMDAAVERIVTALENREPTAVFGDYDVDGATSAALLHRYFAELGRPLRLYVPDRIAEGYGPNADALLRLHGEGIRLVLTVDCGISAHEPLAAAQSAGLDVVVLDHHVAEPALPPAVAVVNPNRLDEDSPHTALAAVGVTFLLLVALNRALRERGRFEGQPEPDLIGLLDLVALGTVCDVVPLRGLNRVLVAQGLKVMARRRNLGLRALADVARMASAPGAYHAGFLLGPRVNAGGRIGLLDLVALGTVCDVVPLRGLNRVLVAQGLKVMARRRNLGLRALADVARMASAPGAYHAGFLLGPRVNAGGRIGRADLGARLLTTDDPAEARRLAEELDRFNTERRDIEKAVLAAALGDAEAQAAEGQPLVLVAGEGWHPGVIGIVASRIVERVNRPACVVALDGAAGKGSCRSIAGVDLGAAVIAARQAGLLVNGGGHRMAAGLTVEAGKVEALHGFLCERVERAVATAGAVRTLGIDAVLTPSAATRALQEQIDRVGPFGAGNPEPRFALSGARIAKADVVGDNHVRCFLADAQGGRLKAIAFRSLGEPLGDALLKAGGGALTLAGKLRADDWKGREDVQFLIDDGAAASG